MSEKDDTEEKYTEYESYYSNALAVSAGLLSGLLIGITIAALDMHWSVLAPAALICLGFAVRAFWKLTH